MLKTATSLLSLTLSLGLSEGCSAIGRIGAGPKIEKLNVDTSTTYTEYDVYGQRDAVFSNNGYPILEYLWVPGRISDVIVSFYFRNTGSDGRCTFIASTAEQKKRTFDLKANTSYVLRVSVSEFGPTLPADSGDWAAHALSLEVMGIEEHIKFYVPRAVESKTDKSTPVVSWLRLEEMGDPGAVDVANLPDKEWFENSVWSHSPRYAFKRYHFVKFRSDGKFGLGYLDPSVFTVDGDETWDVQGGDLTLSWNGGFAFARCKLTNRSTRYLFCTHSRSRWSYMLYRLGKDAVF